MKWFVLVRVVIGGFFTVLLVLGAVGCSSATRVDEAGVPSSMRIWDDPARGVTCYIVYTQAISCVQTSGSVASPPPLGAPPSIPTIPPP